MSIGAFFATPARMVAGIGLARAVSGRAGRWRALAPVGCALLAVVWLAGCSVIRSPTQARGHKVDEDLLKELTPGTSTRADVTALLGSAISRFSKVIGRGGRIACVRGDARS